MFGTLRFFLALLVVMNHVPNNGFAFDVAVSAVILFYLITGHLMGLKYARYAAGCSRPARLFWTDRFLRIYPAYIAVAAVTLGLVAWFGPSRSLPVQIDAVSVVGNALLIPVNYYMFFEGFSLFIPQAFSLALEEQFYLTLPLLLLFPRLIPVALLAGLAVIAVGVTTSLGSHQLTKMTGDYLIYRLLPGAFPIFLLGVFIGRDDLVARRWRRVIVGAYAVLLVAAYLGDTIDRYQVLAVTLGIVGGYPVVSYFARQPRNRWDEILGRGAYGMFLVHFTVIWAFQRFVFPQGVTSPLGFKLGIVTVSIAAGFLIYYFIERPGHRFRQRFIANFIARHPAAPDRAVSR